MQSVKSAAYAAMAAILLTTSAITSAEALSLQRGAQPAEVPPSSYQGNVYIDSRGCAYVRAGVGGRTSWVPRVSRDRQVVCGMAPSLGGATTATTTTRAPAPAPATRTARTPSPAPAPSVISGPSAAAPAAQAPAARGTTRGASRSPSPAPAPTVIPGPQAAAAATPSPVARAPRTTRAPSPAPAPSVVSSGAPAVEASPAAPSVRTVHVACTQPGAVVEVPAGSVRVKYTCTSREQVVRSVQLSNGETLRIIATRSPHEYVRNRPRAPQAAPATGRAVAAAAPRSSGGVPSGYRSAWDDDRLNPQRGPRTAAGNAQMAQVWDDRTPMQPVTAAAPERRRAEAPAPRTTVSTMSAQPAATGQRFVQAASFGDPANAQRTAQRLAAMGLPVRTLRVTRGGKALRLVQAGPFADAASLNAALGKVRGIGFRDAFPTR